MMTCQPLHDITFKVAEGQIVSVVGSNGAGKSTILKSISSLVRIHSGSIEFNRRPAGSAAALQGGGTRYRPCAGREAPFLSIERSDESHARRLYPEIRGCP